MATTLYPLDPDLHATRDSRFKRSLDIGVAGVCSIAKRQHTSDSPVWQSNSPTPAADSSLALFRPRSKLATKKYIRPPCKSVFESLKISTEEWVRLEAEAKAYMLDITHPQRQACVGNKKNGPSNDTKIQLFKTVQRFLADGVGLVYFGEGEGEGEKWVYPADEDRLIALLTPLMRRMVTNERQRQYARRTRNGEVGKKGGDTAMSCSTLVLVGDKDQTSTCSPSSTPRPTPFRLAEDCLECIFLAKGAVAFRYVILSKDTVIDFDRLMEQVRERWREEYRLSNDFLLRGPNPPTFSLRAHSPSGLREISSQEDWCTLLDEVVAIPWMLGYLRIVATLSGDNSGTSVALHSP